MAGRGKRYGGQTRKISSGQDEARLEETLDRIEDLCSHFDTGFRSYALLIAVDVFKALDEGRAATIRRSKHEFPSPAIEDEPENLAAYFPLTCAFLGDAGGSFEALIVKGAPDGWKRLRFNDWWREVIYRESAGGAGFGGIPVNDAPAIEYEKRRRLTRGEIIKLMRDKAGAHHAANYPTILDDFDAPTSWGGFSIQTAGGKVLSTDDKTLPWSVGQLAACTREIAGELLVAYGRRDLPPEPDSSCPRDDELPGIRIYGMKISLAQPDLAKMNLQIIPTNIDGGQAFRS